MHKRFIHIAFDSFFLDYTIDQFETIVPNESDYIVDTSNQINDIKYIKQKQKVSPVDFDNDEKRRKFINDFPNDAILILHCLNQNMIDIVNQIDLNVKIVWLVWGAEVNSLPKLSKNYFLPRTKAILNELKPPSLRSKVYAKFPEIHQFLYKLRRKVEHPTTQKIKALKRINYAGIFVKEDFDLFNTTYNLKLKWLWYCYYNIDDTVVFNERNSIPKHNILIGNSANPTNNHIDAFHKIKNIELENRKIFCPLSYGTDSSSYVQRVITEGELLFGDSFIPLISFIPKENYNEILASCSIVIMNQTRQQAVGNILTSLWEGSKVYLNEINPLYKYLTKMNISIYSIQKDLTSYNQDCYLPLSQKLSLQNRITIQNIFCKENILEQTKKMVWEVVSRQS